MDEPTSLFNSYEQDFKQLLSEVRQKLDGDAAPKVGAEARKATLRRVEMSLDEADEMVSQMQIEIQGIPQSLKAQYTTRLKNAQSDLARYKKLSREAHLQASRTDLFSGAGSGGGGGFWGSKSRVSSDEPYGDDRTRLLAGTEALDDGNRRLQDSERIALETEEQGAGILGTLRRQREQIENSRDQLRTADTSIDRASGTLKKMVRQMHQQRFIIAGATVVLILVVVLILWVKLWRR